MKYIKEILLNEHLDLDYDVGDTVVCIETEYSAGIPPFTSPKLLVKENELYIVLKIYKIYRYKMIMLVDVLNKKTNKIIKGVDYYNFKKEIEFYADKYNL